ncbi:MAG TPA: hypothetical protein VGC04_11240 [Cellulomonas sp.]
MSTLEQHLIGELAQLREQLERQHAATLAAHAATQNGNRLRGSRPVRVGAGGRTIVNSGPGRLVGWSLHAVTAPVTVTLRDSTDTNGDPIAIITVPAGGDVSVPITPGVSFGYGLYADVATAGGVLTGSVWVASEDR